MPEESRPSHWIIDDVPFGTAIWRIVLPLESVIVTWAFLVALVDVIDSGGGVPVPLIVKSPAFALQSRPTRLDSDAFEFDVCAATKLDKSVFVVAPCST